MRRLFRIILIAIALGIVSRPALAQNLLTNPGLEILPPDEGGRYTAAPGWVTSEGPPVPSQPGPIPGDYSNNGFVDAADFVVWRKLLGQNVSMPNEFVTPGSVTIHDFNYWRARFGNPGVLSMSEPSNFAHILETFPPNPPPPDTGDGWQHWFQPYYGTFALQDDNFAHLYQDVSGTPGLNYTMSGWAMGEEIFPGGMTNLNLDDGDMDFEDGPLSPTDVYFALEFLDSSGMVLSGSVEQELKDDLGFVNSGDPDLEGYHWQQFTLNATAPAGTVSVRVRASMTDGVLNPSQSPQSFRMSFFVDEFSLTATAGAGGGSSVPEPSAFLLINAGVAAFAATLRRVRRTKTAAS
jgi:hypothetical protein